MSTQDMTPAAEGNEPQIESAPIREFRSIWVTWKGMKSAWPKHQANNPEYPFLGTGHRHTGRVVGVTMEAAELLRLLRQVESSGMGNVADSASLSTVESAPDTIRDLRSRNAALQSQVEMQKSVLAEVRRNMSRLTREHDQLQAHHDAVEDKMLEQLAQRDSANDKLQAVLVDRVQGRLRMTQSYQGEVVQVSEDRVVVVFQVEGDLVEQTYDRKQFLDGELPKNGDCLAAYVHVAILPVKDKRTVDGGEASHDAARTRRPRNVVPLPRTF